MILQRLKWKQPSSVQAEKQFRIISTLALTLCFDINLNRIKKSIYLLENQFQLHSVSSFCTSFLHCYNDYKIWNFSLDLSTRFWFTIVPFCKRRVLLLAGDCRRHQFGRHQFRRRLSFSSRTLKMYALKQLFERFLKLSQCSCSFPIFPFFIR